MNEWMNDRKTWKNKMKNSKDSMCQPVDKPKLCLHEIARPWWKPGTGLLIDEWAVMVTTVRPILLKLWI